ncbi:MAG: hypothetical protein JO372_18560 [Solirubrobacterales bacterium]|nr:hypothetical protein [Solirubrobacterales bacterium]
MSSFVRRLRRRKQRPPQLLAYANDRINPHDATLGAARERLHVRARRRAPRPYAYCRHDH